jgi:hypothetical protein
MGIIEGIKTFAAHLLNPKLAAQQTELEYLRTVYQQSNNSIQPRQWYRISNEHGDIVGFSFCCACGTEYQLLNTNDWLGRSHECPQCHTAFDVLKDSGINPEKLTVSKWAEKFAALPLRPRLSTIRQSPVIDTWESGNDGTVVWEGSKH